MSRPSNPHFAARSPRSLMGIGLALSVGLLPLLPGTAVAQEPAGGVAGIEGPNWQLLEFRDTEGTVQLVPPGIGATVYLWSKVLAGDGACSSFRSTYTLQQETLIVDAPEVVERACDAEARAIDTALLDNLAQTASQAVDGSILELRNSVGDLLLTFTDAEIPDDPTIAPWQLARIASADGAIGPAIPGSDADIQFLRGGRVVGTTGCGWFLGSYTLNGTIIDIGDVTFRREDCTANLAAQASNIVSTFEDISDFRLLPAGLTLLDSSGVTRMALVPSIPLGELSWTPIAVLDDEGNSLVEQARLRTSAVRFAGERSDGRTICNAFSARSLRSGLAVTVFGINEADAPCRKKAQKGQTMSQQEVEDLFLERLRRASSHALRGAELELMDKEGQPIMRLLPQPELTGVQWVLTAIYPPGGREVPQAPELNARLTATFENPDIGVVQGETGKNSYDADYETPRASNIRISSFQKVGRTCNGKKRAALPLCIQETTFLDLLAQADGYVVATDGLTLLRGSRKLLEFEQARESATN